MYAKLNASLMLVKTLPTMRDIDTAEHLSEWPVLREHRQAEVNRTKKRAGKQIVGCVLCSLAPK
jgi:hypothetical protein